MIAQELRLGDHFYYHFLKHLHIVPIAEVLLDFSQPGERTRTARDPELIHHFEKVTEPLGGDARGVDGGRGGLAVRDGNLLLKLVPDPHKRLRQPRREGFKSQSVGLHQGMRKMVRLG